MARYVIKNGSFRPTQKPEVGVLGWFLQHKHPGGMRLTCVISDETHITHRVQESEVQILNAAPIYDHVAEDKSACIRRR